MVLGRSLRLVSSLAAVEEELGIGALLKRVKFVKLVMADVALSSADER